MRHPPSIQCVAHQLAFHGIGLLFEIAFQHSRRRVQVGILRSTLRLQLGLAVRQADKPNDLGQSHRRQASIEGFARALRAF